MRSRRFDMHKLKVSLVAIFVFWVTLGVFNAPSVMAQHEGHTTPPKPAATPASKPAARPAQPTPTPTPVMDHAGLEAQPAIKPTPTPSHVHDTTATSSTEESLLVMSEDEMGITVGENKNNVLPTSFIWGRNHESHGDDIFNLNGYVAESTVNFQDKNYLYTRLELVDKNQLLRDEDRLLLGITEHHPSFRIGAYTFGGARDVYTNDKLRVAVGTDITFYSKPPALDPIYGDNPVSYRFFLRFRPGKMSMSGHNGAHGSMKH